ncbi:hypothetical protein QUF76_02625 [Desulfobacterales bacterium HSG16]|nr:hypothetical protein [Desulfobacterales bacterium HSG16]
MKNQKIKLVDKENILRFFLNLYKTQSGTDTGEYLSTTIDNFDPTSSYNLRVQKYEEWKSRRVSIAPLGDGSGSKSKCFKVIYDEVLVVKIPPVPIKSFDQYLECIETERRIVDKLSPDIVCIIPNVSTILKRIPPFSRDIELAPEVFEKKCIERLKKDPYLQNYLKIDDSFVFFMNLTKYSFLSNVIDKLHDISQDVAEEILSHTDILQDLILFEDKFGSAGESLFYKINEVYGFYNKEVNRLAGRIGNLPAVSASQTIEWFLSLMIGKMMKEDDSSQYSSQFIQKMKIMSKQVLTKYRKEIEEYRRTMTTYVRQKKFIQNKSIFEGLITNILEMIGDLKNKCVAIRDLKPDNLFVVGDWEKNPLLLASHGSYSLGLIDFETSVSFDTKYDVKIDQPLLAGTPSYSTPSHLFENTLLEKIYKDLPRILFFQDWQAVTNMIYNVATGKHLAQKTGRVLPETMRTMRITMKEGKPLPDVYIRSNGKFWREAANELKEKLKNSKADLKSIQVVIPDQTKDIFKQELSYQNSKIKKSILKQVKSHKIFKSKNVRRTLIKAPPEIIARYKAKWKKGIGIPKAPPKVRAEIISFLDKLESRKRRKNHIDRILESMDQALPELQVYELLKVMFFLVHETMHKPEWNSLPDIDEPGADMENISHEETIVYEQTLVYQTSRKSETA